MKKTLYFFLSLAIALVGCSHEDVEYTSIESLKNAKIAVAMGSIHDTYVTEHFPDASIQRTETMIELPLLLSGGRVDYIILDENVSKSMLMKSTDLEVVDRDIFVSEIAAGFSYNNQKLCDEFNQFISRFSKSDTYADIVKRWHVDGDGGEIPHIDVLTSGKKLRVGLSSLIPPFCIVRDNQLQGSSVEIAKHFALEYGYVPELLDMNITGLLSSVQTNRVDLLIPGLIYTKERAESILFSDIYLHSGSVVVARKRVEDESAKEEEFVYSQDLLEDSRILVMTGTTSDLYAVENFPDAEIVRVDNIADFLPMLKKNSADFLIADIPQFVEIQAVDPQFVIAEDDLYSIGVAFVLPKTHEALRDEMNDYLRRFMPTDEFKEMYDRWIERGDISNIPEIERVKSDRKILIATDPNNFPYVTIVDGKLTGFEIELMNRFALASGIEIEYMQMNFPAIISALSSKKVDVGFATVCVTEERKKRFLFTDPYLSVASGVGYLDKNRPKYKEFVHPEVVASKAGERPNVDDSVRCYINGRIASTVEGTIQEQYLSSILPASQVAIAKDYADALLVLVSGKADFMLTNIGTASSFKKANESIEIVLQDIFAYDTCYGLSKDRGELRGEINEFLGRLSADGTLAKLREKWFTDLGDAEFEQIEYDPKAPVLRVGSGCTAVPFTFISNGRAVGLDIEVLALFCKDAGYRLEVVEMPFGALISSIVTGKVDVIANTLSPTAERKEKIDFTDAYGRNCFALIHSRELLVSQESGDGDGEKVGFFGSLKSSFIRNVITEDRYKMIIDGVWVTIIISFLSIIFGTILGAFICSMTMSKSKFVKWIGNVYVTIVRGTPVLVILMINFYVIFAQTPMSPVWVATISFAMNFGAYVSEMFRSSIISIDRGQREAGLAMGFTSIKTFIFVIAPQAITRVLPVYKGEAISLVKMTSIVGYIAVQDITKVGDIIRSRTFDAFFPLLVSALLYFLIAYIFSILLDLLTAKITHQR